jgi:hypothetical protein
MDTLPLSILGEILSFLPLGDFAQCHRVSHKFLQCCKGNSQQTTTLNLINYFWKNSMYIGIMYLAIPLKDDKLFDIFLEKAADSEIPSELAKLVIYHGRLDLVEKIFSKTDTFERNSIEITYVAAKYYRIEILKFLEDHYLVDEEGGRRGAWDGQHKDLMEYYTPGNTKKLKDLFPL